MSSRSRTLLALGALVGVLGCATKSDKASTLLAVGSVAPDAAALDQDGKLVRLADFRGKPVVLWFYPADFTAG